MRKIISTILAAAAFSIIGAPGAVADASPASNPTPVVPLAVVQECESNLSTMLSSYARVFARNERQIGRLQYRVWQQSREIARLRHELAAAQRGH